MLLADFRLRPPGARYCSPARSPRFADAVDVLGRP